MSQKNNNLFLKAEGGGGQAGRELKAQIIPMFVPKFIKQML